jgi:hypothetical protein
MPIFANVLWSKVASFVTRSFSAAGGAKIHGTLKLGSAAFTIAHKHHLFSLFTQYHNLGAYQCFREFFLLRRSEILVC